MRSRHLLLVLASLWLPSWFVAALRAESIRLEVSRDNWFSNVGREADGNNGGAPRLKLKSIQEMSILDIDPTPLRGRVVTSATLHLRSAGKPFPKRVSVSSFAADWVEGTASGYEPQAGSSTFRHRRHPDTPWTIPGSDLCSVVFGQGGTVWRSIDASAPTDQGWQAIKIDPILVALRTSEISQGFFLFDDTGSEWTRQGEKFEQSLFPNRFVFSRDSNRASAPYFDVELGPEDHAPPAAPRDIKSETSDLPRGEALVSWVTPADSGQAGTVGFQVKINNKDVPRYLIPASRLAGQRVLMHVRDLDLTPDREAEILIRAVDGAGNVGPEQKARFAVSGRKPMPLPGTNPQPFRETAPLPMLGKIEVAILDELDKVQPETGEMVPPHPESYLAANHLWSAKEKKITLHAARNEFVAFQVLVKGAASDLRPVLTFSDSSLPVTLGRYETVSSRKGPMPDPIVPLNPHGQNKAQAPRTVSFLVEVYVPHEEKPGTRSGVLTLKSGGDVLNITVDIHVWNFVLPDALSFIPEMNCYGLPENEMAYYRLAHAHRTVLNRVPYSQNGVVHDGCAPRWDGKTLDWTDWDRRFGPLLDGTAFANLPRRGVPIECFYLPMHENWPTPMAGNYNDSYWADQAFPPSYRQTFVEVACQFAEHLNAKGWNETFFQFFLNGKNDFKRNGWSRGSSPWLLDEPANWQDYEALHWFGLAFHEGVNLAPPGRAKLVFRCDISRPQWQRDSFDHLLDYNVIGSAFRTYRRMVLDRKASFGEIVLEYGGTNALEDSNIQPVAWAIDTWCLGADGVLPWQTVGTSESWTKADPLSLFYPGHSGADPIPSIRLKAYRRGQQDVEYLTLLAQAQGQPRWAIGESVREALHLAGERKSTGAGDEDAGLIDYGRLTAEDIWTLRVRIGQVLSDKRIEPRSKSVELRTPPRSGGVFHHVE